MTRKSIRSSPCSAGHIVRCRIFAMAQHVNLDGRQFVSRGEKRGACCWWVKNASQRKATRSASRIRSEPGTPSLPPSSMAWERDGLPRKWLTLPTELGPWSPAGPGGLLRGPSEKQKSSRDDVRHLPLRRSGREREVLALSQGERAVFPDSASKHSILER